MAHTYRPSAALATRWRTDVFFRARIKLTGLFLLVMLVVLTLFSITLYFNISSDIRESLGHSVIQGIDPDRFFEDRDTHILSVLLFVDGVILLVSGAMGYLFAGYVLEPITAILRSQERFTADAAHELRTPLTVIQSQIEVLLRSNEPIPKRTHDMLDSILDETKNLTGITKDLLLAARHDLAPRHKDQTTVSVADVTNDVVHNLHLMAEKKNNTIDQQIGDGLMVYASRDGVRRILTNVIENALKYTSPGGHIWIEAHDEGNASVRINIRDDGSGISPEDLPHVFERFYKADNARQTAGTGLGLSIVKELVGSFGGNITIQSSIGTGTEVTIWLKKAS